MSSTVQIKKNNTRNFTKIDQICIGFDQALQTLVGKSSTTGRKYPALTLSEPELTVEQKKHSAALMRINHAGEVCAQALYHSQGLLSRAADVREKMQHAAIEEGDHLAWCGMRLIELGSHTSYLNPLWYVGSFAIGLTAGIVGDKWSLGFLAETETQVVEHLKNQLDLLPSEDTKSQLILLQMQQDESQHRDDAVQAGAKNLPNLLKSLMKFTSKIMVKVSYWI